MPLTSARRHVRDCGETGARARERTGRTTTPMTWPARLPPTTPWDSTRCRCCGRWTGLCSGRRHRPGCRDHARLAGPHRRSRPAGRRHGHAPAFAAAFASLSAELTDDDGRPLACDPAAFALAKVQFRTTDASGDCCTPALPWGDLPIADFLSRSRTARADGFDIRYLDRVDLIRMRRAAGRPKDLRRAVELDQDV